MRLPILRAATGLSMVALLAACGPISGTTVEQANIQQALALQNRDWEPAAIKTADQIPVVGKLYSAPKPKAIIILFHQAGSSKDEYNTIAPRLVKLGYTALSIDQRVGGSLFGDNSTLAIIGGKQVPFEEAQNDMQGAVDWVREQYHPLKLPVILWGSSYSAALVFPVAVDNADVVKGVLAFSPDEYLADKTVVKKAAAQVTAPVFVTSAKEAGEIAAAKAVLGAVPGADKTQFVPKIAGVHGSSTLIDARDPKGAAENWAAVEAFLKHVAP